MKKLLFLGGGFLQKYVIIKAKQLGYYVLVLDADPNAVGFNFADEHAVINIVDGDACLAYAKEHGVDGVLTAATDFSVLTMSRIATELSLPGINYNSAKIIKNKAAVRKCLFDAAADDTGYSFEISSVESVKDIENKIHFPVMVKPCDGSGSRGANRVNSVEDLEKNCVIAMNSSISHRAVIEPFVDGREYGVESFVDQGVIHVLAVMQKDMTLPPYYAELGHAIPSGLSTEMEYKVKNCVTKALVALGVNHGSVNMDLLINDNGDVHIVDVGARMGGNLIGSHIIPYGTGIDYMGNMIKAAVGDSTDFHPIWQPVPVATKLLALHPGKVKSLPDFSKISIQHDVIIEHHLHEGDQINEYHTNLDGCGYVVVRGGIDIDDAKIRSEETKILIDNSIERDKRILVIGAGSYQTPAIKRIRDLGYDAFCVDYKEGQEGFAYSNGYRIIDVKAKEACLLYARELKIDGILSWGSTLTLPTVSYIGEAMNLRCLPKETSEISVSKYKIRKRLTEKGLNSDGDCFEFHNWEEVNQHKFKVPFVVKPSDGSGSKGVRIVLDEAEINDAVKYAFDSARNNEIYVEPYIEGQEVSVEAYVCDGDVFINTIINTEFHWTDAYPIYCQTTYLGVSPEDEQAIEVEVKKAVRALNVNFGPINFDIILSSTTRKPYIIDVGIRNGQNLIASHIIPYSRGVNELDNSIKYCLGIQCDPSPKFRKYISSRLLIYTPGVIKEIKPITNLIGKKHIVDIVLRKKVGDRLNFYTTKSDICGWVLVEGESPEDARYFAEQAWSMLKEYIIIE